MEINFNKNKDGLVPAVIQDVKTKQVLMLGYMNEEAYQKTIKEKKVTFFSRSKQRLWTKGEESGNNLELIDLKLDCDQDTLLILVKPKGPTCHKGTDTCFGNENLTNYGFISKLEDIILDRQKSGNIEQSYIASLFQDGINKIAQKVGEEAVELIIEAKDDNDKLFLNESADLLFHYLILLRSKGYSFMDIVEVL
ncbi:bifunctional phosphoribosyl-AMP cyclohydrolase/phosphoribosyl-ATP diphosphatase HisIE, partial [Psychroflexus aestuariivivens]|uniref:bifunctional phosphoribosyl-AMP cyclohydrolase/phosphoribosyl-ATP diphosphatase HisIE n=1 Tax=Psychroflexus aestuariivivens TaxID=1795040 RepID=UPI000FDA105E